MKQLKLGICFLDENNNVVSKRVVVEDWDIHTENLHADFYDDKMQSMVSDIQLVNLNRNLKREDIESMLNEIKEDSE